MVEVRQDGELIASEPITFVQDTAPPGVPQLAMPWHGVLKLPSLDPQVGITFELWPDSRAFLQLQQTGQPIPMVEAFEPFMRFTVYRGDLVDPSPRSLDTAGLRRGAAGSSARARPWT